MSKKKVGSQKSAKVTKKKVTKKPVTKKKTTPKKKATTKKVTKKKPLTKKAVVKKKSGSKSYVKKASDSNSNGELPIVEKGSSHVERASFAPIDVQTKTARRKMALIYPDFDVYIYKKGYPEGVLTIQYAKEYLGWETETQNRKFGNNYLFKDMHGNKVRCLNNLTNRPFDMALAMKYALETLRLKWRLNGETIIIDQRAMIHNGQHRLIGLVLADQLRQIDPQDWKKFWKVECFIETLVVVGIGYDDDTINTIDTGKKRSLSDVVYRCGFFDEFELRDRKKIAKMFEYAVKFLWDRTGAAETSFAPSRPHSESLEFIDSHPTLLEFVKFIWEAEGGTERCVSSLVSLGQATGMMYLMATEESEQEVYHEYLTESGVNFDLREQAEDFWTKLAERHKGYKVILTTIESARKKYKDAAPTLVRRITMSTIAKAWHLHVSGELITEDGLAWTVAPDEWDTLQLTDEQKFDGIDYVAPADEN